MAEKDTQYQAYWDAIRRRVCGVCLDQKDDGACGLTGRVCAIDTHLAGIVATVVAVQSDRMDDYVSAIQSQICGRCAQQDEQGRCGLRDKGECALDTYLYLVVDAVQEVREAAGRPLMRSA